MTPFVFKRFARRVAETAFNFPNGDFIVAASVGMSFYLSL
jgi:hypothetical protein